MLIAETRPSKRGGVTDWRSVVVLITQRIGPAPNRKKLSPARSGVWTTVVSAMIPAATKPVTGPRPITVPNGSQRITRVASRAPNTIPIPYMPSTRPTPAADRPSERTA